MKKLIIFGIGSQAELAHFYFSKETEYEVTAFSVDKAFITSNTFCTLPVIPFEDINVLKFPTNEYEFFVAIGYNKVNQIREQKYSLIKSMGYRLATFISPKVSNYAKSIGENCFILEDNTIQPFVSIGNNVTLWSGNHIGHHSTIEDNCFITSHVVISGGCHIGKFTFIGVNSTIRDQVRIGHANVIGAGALILKDTNDFDVYIGAATEVSKVPSNRLRGI